jgi:class 3 adenylate cyclase/HAMP domain-containing protein
MGDLEIEKIEKTESAEALSQEPVVSQKDIEELSAKVADSIDKNLEESREYVIDRRNSIKNRLQKTFFIISTAIIFLMSVFSLVYFYFFTKGEATSLIRNKMLLADVFLESQRNETLQMAENIAVDRAVQIGIELGSGDKLTGYLMSLAVREKHYYITLFDREGNILSDIGKTDSALFLGRKQITAPEQALFNEAIKNQAVVDTISIANGFQEPFPAYIAAVPVKSNGEFIGIVMVRFVFSDNYDFFIQLSRNLGSSVAVYVDANPIVSTADSMEISYEHYNDITRLNRGTELIGFAGAGLNEYQCFFSNSGEAVSVIHLYMSPLPYITTFGAAIIIYIIFAILVLVVVSSVVRRIAATILNPLAQLLDGINIIRSGDLRYEISTTVNDEIGRLGNVFNDMRKELNEKIVTIETINNNLEKTIEERTKKLDTLNQKMKHYLSPQLYTSIAGGDRDASTERHYRKKLTIFFSDIADFTSTTESMESEDLSTLLNSYLNNMSIIAEKYGGTIDKFVGDAVMVFFGDPVFTSDKDHALRAVKMALEMQSRMDELRVEWGDVAVKYPFHIRIGINTGYCTIGNFGSDTKMDYTIIGNNVNLAARYEAAAKPDAILMSYETYMFVRDEIECIEEGEYELKGIGHTVKGYSPVRYRETAGQDAIKLINEKEIVFPRKIINLDELTKPERRALLLNIKSIFDAIKTGK